MTQLVAVVGPTATGKSALGVALARQLGGEVVNADSMQLYRGMDIGTAKLGESERDGVRHHLLDIWDVTRTASVADYQQQARAKIDELIGRGITPVLVGGSGLYVRAVIDPIDFPGTDEAIRGALEAELVAGGPEALHRKLAAADPVTAAALSPLNGRKIVRALEVIAITGRPFTAALPSYDEAAYDTVQIGLDLDTAVLDDRLERRVDVMIEAGFEDEVRRLDAQGLRQGVTASRALGYAQLLAVIDGGIGLAAARADTIRATRRFVRRQRSWFRRDPRITWLDAATDPLTVALKMITTGHTATAATAR
ncbi:MAG TPA: tRNA (adenosine(37)-N6)-dimethylallyltransferase MiaA [Mycobacteriales bacterium]|jgi:tRNA dimethylallyltransferase|nr:tRNA (adenosine(37)-N6)-dimethylallyltransferase MiaA [Mycobacteriales bacterium]HVX69440.1 tRNA (adenosine(37)-N6)-dimethylallyltransferase MiaA [Mycobacteriales bacterium]